VSRRVHGALVLLLAVAVGCGHGNGSARTGSDGAPSSTSSTTTATNRHVLVMGDSNVFQSAEGIDRALRRAGFEPIVHGVPGYGLKNLDGYWLPELGGLLADDPPVVVVALGTNDTASDAEVQAVAGGIDTLMRALGDRRVVWITHVDDRPYSVANAGSTVNAAIRAATARWPNLDVIDLAPELASNPGLLSDGLHFSAVGMQVYVGRIVAAVAAAYEEVARA
jgi:hypothetical protein